MVDTIFQRRIKNFNNRYDIDKLDEHFNMNISNKKQSIIKISAIINEPEKDVDLKIKFLHKPFDLKDTYFLELPMEINRLISSYIPSYIEINTRIHFCDEYPFRPPKWSLTSVVDKSSSYINLQEYYEYIVNCHNNQYQRSWSPAIWIETDILCFVLKINHFEHIIDF